MGEVSTNTTVLPDIKELDRLLSVLQSNNVYSFKFNGMEVLLSPQIAPASSSSQPETTNVLDEFGNYGIWTSKELGK
jgi:hypothetical protein